MTGITRLDHVNLRTAHLDAMVQWYEDILGFHVGPRPNFSFGGAWLYRGEDALVHLVEVDTQPAEQHGLKMEHVAFSSSGLSAFREMLESKGVHYELLHIADFDITQMNIWDPDGNHLHIDFIGER